MSNSGSHYTSKLVRPAASRQGYIDRLAGRPYAPEYEKWDSLAQENYENTRLAATNILLAGLRAPPWPNRPTREFPRAISAALIRAYHIVGSALPGQPTKYDCRPLAEVDELAALGL